MIANTKKNINKIKIICLYPSCFPLLVLLNILIFNNLKASDLPFSDSTIKRPVLRLRAFYQQGRVLQTNAFVRGKNMRQEPISSFRTISLQLFRQTTGEKLWEQLYNYPRYGIGINSLQFIHTKELGNPFAIYGTLSIPFIRGKKVSFYTYIGAGLTFSWKSFKEDNYNTALGCSATSFIDVGFYLEYDLCNGLLIDIGASETHYSNGSLKLPNLGINTFAPKIGVGYKFNRSTEKFYYQVVPEYKNQSECLVSVFTGLENRLYDVSAVDSVSKIIGVYYASYGLSVTFNRQISYKSKLGIGIMGDYLGSANTTIKEKNGNYTSYKASFGEGLELSIYPSYELVINRLSVIMQAGFFLYRTEYPFRTPDTYQRIGLKYNVLKDFSLGLYMRTHRFSIADYIEWTVVYRIHL